MTLVLSSWFLLEEKPSILLVKKRKNTEGHFGVLQVKRMYDEDIQIFHL